MQSERFEQLVSEWLDHPHRDDLREQIEATVRAQPDLAATRGEYERLQNLLCNATAPEPGVRWPRFRQEARARIQESRDAAVPSDESLRRLTAADEHVDWDRFRADVIASIGARSKKPRRIRFSLPFRMGLVASAAAAIIAMIFLYPNAPTTPDPRRPATPTASPGYARVSVGVFPPAASSSAAVDLAQPTQARVREAIRKSYARITISGPSQAVAASADDDAPRVVDLRADSRMVEVFLMVEPQRSAIRAQGAMNPLAMN